MKSETADAREMSGAATSSSLEGGRWAAVVRPSAGIATAEASMNDVFVIVMADARDQVSDALRARLADLLVDAHDAPAPAAGRRPIPVVMQRVVRSLVEWAEQIERETPGRSMWALGFLHSTAAPVFAQIGGDEAQFVSESGALTPQSLLLRGEGGVRARAYCLQPGRLAAISMSWSATAADGSATVAADWLLEPRETDDVANEPGDAMSLTLVEGTAGVVEPEAETHETPQTIHEQPGITTAHYAVLGPATENADVEPPTDEVLGETAPPVLEPVTEATIIEPPIRITGSAVDAPLAEPAAHVAEPAADEVPGEITTDDIFDESPTENVFGDLTASDLFRTPSIDDMVGEPGTDPLLDELTLDDLLGEPVADSGPGASEPAVPLGGETATDGLLGAPAGHDALAAAAADDFLAGPSTHGAHAEPAAREAVGEPATRDAFRESTGLDGFREPATRDALGEPATHDTLRETMTLDGFREPVAGDVLREPASLSLGEPANHDVFTPKVDGPVLHERVIDGVLGGPENAPFQETPGPAQEPPRNEVEPTPSPVREADLWSSLMLVERAEVASAVPSPEPTATTPKAREDRWAAPTPAPSEDRWPAASIEADPTPFPVSVEMAPESLGIGPIDVMSDPPPFGDESRFADGSEPAPALGSTPRTQRPARPLPTTGSAALEAPAPSPNAQRPKPWRPKLNRAKLTWAPRHADGEAEGAPVVAARKPWQLPVLAAVVVIGVIVGIRALGGGGSSRHASHPGAPAANAGAGDVAAAAAGPGAASKVVVRAFAEGDDNTALRGIQVWVDGKSAAATPITLSLEPGPHSIRVSRGGQDSRARIVQIPAKGPQVVDFKFGTWDNQPRMAVLPHAAPSMLDRVATLSVFLDGADTGSVQELWLNLRSDGVWNRYPMSMIAAPGGTVGVAVLKAPLLQPSSAPAYYATVTMKTTEDQYSTELVTP